MGLTIVQAQNFSNTTELEHFWNTSILEPLWNTSGLDHFSNIDISFNLTQARISPIVQTTQTQLQTQALAVAKAVEKAKVQAKVYAKTQAKKQAKEQAKAKEVAKEVAKAKEIAKSRITGKQPQKNIIISIGSRQIQIPANLSLSNQKKNLIQMTDNIIAQLTGKEEKYIQINETTKKDQGITISVGSKQILIPFKLSNKEKREKIAQLANKITLQKFSNTTELESFGNTPILEPYWNKPILDPSWNKPQPQPEVVQNTEAINNNKLPMGIYSSNSVSMYASIRY